MPAGKNIPLGGGQGHIIRNVHEHGFSCIHEPAQMAGQENSGQVAVEHRKVVQREPWTCRRQEEIAEVRQKESVNAGEEEEVKHVVRFPPVDFVAQQDEQEEERCIGDLKEFREPWVGELHQPLRGINAEHPAVDRNKEAVVVPPEVQRLDHEVELFEREKDHGRNVPVVDIAQQPGAAAVSGESEPDDESRQDEVEGDQ